MKRHDSGELKRKISYSGGGCNDLRMSVVLRARMDSTRFVLGDTLGQEASGGVGETK